MDKNQSRRQLMATASFIPHRVMDRHVHRATGRDYEILDAALLYSDISGFTAMSEKLIRMGKEGSEEVNRIINNFFQPVIGIIDRWGGDIYRFGGDSILTLFPAIDRGRPPCRRAARAASEIIAYVHAHSRLRTRAGSFQIRIHSALAAGRVYFQDLRTDYVLGGSLANSLMQIIDQSGPGEIVVNAAARKELMDLPLQALPGGLWKVRRTKRAFPAQAPDIAAPAPDLDPSAVAALTNAVKDYLPEWLYRRIQLKQTFDPSDGEHRRAAVIFLHYSGIPYDADPRRAAARQRGFYAAVRETLDRYGGWLNALDIYKDSSRVMATFGFPVIHGDDEQRACLFAYDLLKHPALKGLKVRAGINAGSIFAGPVGSDLRREYAALGDAVNLAARLAAHAAPGTIQVSGAVYDKTCSSFRYEALGAASFKGKKQAIPLYHLAGRKEAARTALTRWLSESEHLVGRNAELQTIRDRIGHVARSRGQILHITGEAGIGKSRIVQEMVKELNRHGFYGLSGGCLSYGSAFSYHPWVDVLTQFFGILPADAPAVKQGRIRDRVRAADRKLLPWLPVIGEIMGVAFPETTMTRYLNAKVKKQRVFDIIFDLLKEAGRAKPVAVIIEDIHWVDTASLELINYIGRNIEDKPMLLALISRPVDRADEFLEKKYTTVVALKELSRDDSLELIQNLLSIKDVPRDLKDLIIDKSQGNPFYIEELVKSLIEQGYIVEDRQTWKFVGDIKGLTLPDTVEAVILNRIDRLDLLSRDVIQVASVLGREFEEHLIRGIYPQPEQVETALRTLQNLDLIRQEKGRRQVNYSFKHIMTREAAYDTLAYAKRRDLHCRTGAYIETTMKNRREELLGLLSHHYFQGGDYEKALVYSVEAGDKARKVYANEEAIEFYTRAIEAYEGLEKPGRRRPARRR